MTDAEAARARMIGFLRREHANERGAARAYAGHWRSVRDPAEREAIAAIEAEEWHHREILAKLLADLGTTPITWLEPILGVGGFVLGCLCFVTGWLAPMFGAGWIERINAQGYLDAAEDARRAGLPDLAGTLVELGAVEIRHHEYFHGRVRTHWLGSRLPLRPPLPLPGPPAAGGLVL